MKILCLGSNSSDTDAQAHEVAIKHGFVNRGLVSSLNDIVQENSVYHTSLADVSRLDLLSICKNVDRVIILHQPLEQWDSKDLYFSTIETAKLLREHPGILVDNLLAADTAITFFTNLVQENKSFCIFPFIELLTTNGSTTLCCRTGRKVTTVSELTDWQNDPAYSAIRKDMINGVRRPDYCRVCYELEDKGVASARQQETVEWANRLNLTSLEDLKKIKDPVYYEVRPSNICNLMCRMCDPQSSSLIYNEYVKLGLFDPQQYHYSDYSIINVNLAKKIYISGGEPTATPQLYEFLEKMVSSGHHEVELLINTNAAKISKKLLHLFSKFKNLSFIVSIDGFQNVNDYVRHKSTWDAVVKNLSELLKNHQVYVNITVTVYNIFSLHKLIQFLDSMNVPIHLQDGGNISNEVSYTRISGFELVTNLETIKDTRVYQTDTLVKSYIDGLLNWATSSFEPDLNKLTKFFEFNDLLDNSRGVKLANYIPELEHYRHVIQKIPPTANI